MTQYSDSMKQRSLAALLIFGGVYGLEKMLNVDTKQGLGMMLDYGTKAGLLAGAVGYALGYINSKTSQREQ